jgi:phytol kinase
MRGKLAFRLLVRTPVDTLRRVLDLFLSSLPSLRTLLVVAPIALLYSSAVAWMVGWLRCVRNVRTAYTRKLFHFTIFTMATLVHLRWGLPGVTVLGTVTSLIVLYGVWRGSGNRFYEALARPSDAPHRTLFIIIPLLTTIIGGVLTNTFFPVYAYVGYLVCGWGDAVGEPVGTRWGRHKYRVPSLSGVPAARSLEGSLAVFVVGSAAAIIGFYAYGHPPRNAVLVGIACGLAGAIVEAVSTHGLDNLTTQVAAAAVATLLG